MKLLLKTFISVSVLLLNAACFVTTLPPAPTATPTLAATATPTIVWFPPTSTPVVPPTAAPLPTPDLRPGVGSLLLEDDFSENSVWSTITDSYASVAIANARINLSLRSGKDYLLTTRTSPIFADFYLEITANPSICQGADEYGLIVRNDDGDHYRLSLTCDGRASVQRFFNNSLSRQTEWVENPTIPNLAPSSSRLAVWADGNEIRFFVNDLYLFSVTDRELFKGTVGVFVHTSGESDVSVSFSELEVWELED
ncbi:MAG: hypothetical protein WEC37_04510 [Anaerolineales bacterium]